MSDIVISGTGLFTPSESISNEELVASFNAFVELHNAENAEAIAESLIQDRVAAGWFLRGLHHHGSSAMVVVTALHLMQVVIAGAYRKPREVNWWTGLLMGGLVLAFALTGYLLPWDQRATGPRRSPRGSWARSRSSARRSSTFCKAARSTET